MLTEEQKKELDEKAQYMGEAVKKSLGIDNLNSDIASIKEAMEKKKEAEIFKVFVAEDVQKDINELTSKEKATAFARALVFRDEVALKALSESANADGLYTVPQDFYNMLLEEIKDEAVMRNEVTVVPMKTNTLTLTMALNGPNTYWTGEMETKTTTSMEFSQPTITARKLASIIYLSDELIDDSAFDLTNVIIRRFAEEIAVKEDRAILVGNGTTQPSGIFSAGTISTIACSGNLDFDDIINLVYALPIKYRRIGKAKFLVNTENVRELRKVKDSNNRYIWEEPISKDQPATIMGYEVIEHPDVSVGSIAFGNFKETYWLGDRQSITVKITQDSETTYTKDLTGIRVVERVGGTVVQPRACRILNTIP